MKLKVLKASLAITSITVLLAGILVGCGRTEINANDYITLECTGYDTIGTVTATVNISDMVTDHAKVFGLNENASAAELTEVVTDISSFLNGTLDKNEFISNGDVITFTWNTSDLSQLEDKYSAKWIADPYSVTVNDLVELEPYNPFDYISVRFYHGESDTLLCATIDEVGENPVSSVYYHIEPSADLQVGDIITITAVTASDRTFEEYCLMNGKRVSETEMQMVVHE